MSLELDSWLDQLNRKTIENSLAIFDIKFEYPEYLDIYLEQDALVLVWKRGYIPHISIFGNEKSILNIMNKRITPFHENLIFYISNDTHKDLIHDNFEIQKQTNLHLYYLNKECFVPSQEHNVNVVPLNKKYSTIIQELWEYSNQINDLNYIDERMTRGYFYGILINNELVSFIGTLAELDKTVVLGMLFTQPEFRNKHYGSSCAYFLTKKILETNRTPLCYVDIENDPSISIWEKLGYQKKPGTYYFINTMGLK